MNDTAPVDEHHERPPILHSPYDEPDRHWEIADQQTTGQIKPLRRPAEQPIPMGAPPRHWNPSAPMQIATGRP